MNKSSLCCIFISLMLVVCAVTAYATSNISTTNKYAWSETSGWLNFAPTGGGVTVYGDHLEGYAWGENIGWIKLGSHTGGGVVSYGNSTASDWGVNRSGATLSGFAWSDATGWINFAPTGGGVTLNQTTGTMDGYAWGENIGWIHTRNASPAYGLQFVPTFKVSAIVFDGVNGYAAQDGGGIWKTTNSGANWIAATTQPVSQRIKGLVIHPTIKTALYAATYGGGIYKSTDSADTWTACPSAGMGSLNGTTLAIAPTGKLYAGTEAGIFTSSDCATWSPANGGLVLSAATPPVSIVVDPTTPTTVHAALDGAGIFRSSDGGVTWTNPGLGLISWWPASGNANDNVGGNNGSINGNMTTTTGYTGNAFSFSGINNGYVSVPDNSSLRPAQFSISLWLQWNNMDTNTIGFLTGKSLEDYEIHTGGGAGVNGLRFIPAGDPETTVDAPGVILSGWNHVVVTYSGSQSKIYVNGTLSATRSNITSGNVLSTDTAQFQIGRRFSTPYYPLNGKIDETALFGRVLNANEVATIYSAGTASLAAQAAGQPAGGRIKALVMKDSATVYAASYGSGVYKSINGGITWGVCANSGLTNQNVISLAIDANGKLYAGTEAGVFSSADACGTWVSMNSGLP
jgi:photosystem II stability/assembly factor-like uncharacterized protein